MTMLHTVDFLYIMTDIMTTCCFFGYLKIIRITYAFCTIYREAAVGTWETSGSWIIPWGFNPWCLRPIETVWDEEHDDQKMHEQKRTDQVAESSLFVLWQGMFLCKDVAKQVWWIIYIYTHTYTHIHTYIHTYLPTYLPTYLHTYIPTYLHTYIPTYLHTYIPTYLHTYIRTYVHTYIHT